MAIEIYNFDEANELVPTVEPLSLRVPGDENEAILVHCKPQLAPGQLTLAIHAVIGEIIVSRHGSGGIQVVDASPSPLSSHLPNYAFTEPVDSVVYRHDPGLDVWKFEPSEQIANRNILQTFSHLICTHALMKQRRDRQQ
jgi:hypothetical protein